MRSKKTTNPFAQLGFLLIGALICAAPKPAHAQRAAIEPRAIGEIVNAVLDSLLPSKGSTRNEVLRRGILFDRRRTLAAFHQKDSVPASALALRHSMQEGSASLLDDCNQRGTKPCNRLGAKTYFYVKPISITETKAHVWVVMLFANRGARSGEDSTPKGRAYLNGGSTEVYLTRAKGGSWKFLKMGISEVM